MYTRNLTPSRTSSRTPYEVWHVNKWSPTQPDRNTPFSGSRFRIVIKKGNLKIRTRSILLRIARRFQQNEERHQSLLKQRSKAGRPEEKTQKSQENQREYLKALNITMQQKSAGRTKKLQNIFPNRKMVCLFFCFFFVFRLWYKKFLKT